MVNTFHQGKHSHDKVQMLSKSTLKIELSGQPRKQRDYNTKLHFLNRDYKPFYIQHDTYTLHINPNNPAIWQWRFWPAPNRYTT